MSDVWRTVYSMERDKATGNDPASLRREIDRLNAMVLTLSEALVIQDSYGVQGSEFSTCLACGAGGAPGIPFKHTERCPAGRAEETAERWVKEQRDEVEDLCAEETRLRAALTKIRDGLAISAYGRNTETFEIAQAALGQSAEGNK